MPGRRFRHPDIQYARAAALDWGTKPLANSAAPGRSEPHRYRSVYPDASIAETFDHVSATEYTLHATVRSGGKTITSVDTCLRSAR